MTCDEFLLMNESIARFLGVLVMLEKQMHVLYFWKTEFSLPLRLSVCVCVHIFTHLYAYIDKLYTYIIYIDR
jgi:hypothetical protein